MSEVALANAIRPANPTVQGRFAAALRLWWSRLDERRRLRLTIHALNALSDRTLRDIGLERHNIEAAVRERGKDA